MTDISTTPHQKWPTVIGVISIVLAVPSLVCLPGFAIFSIYALIMKPDDASSWTGNGFLICMITWISMSVILLIAGINLMRRRQPVRMPYIVSSVLWIVTLFVWLIVYVVIMSTAPQIPWSPLMIFAMAIGTMICALFALAWPVFVLIWFNRTKIKQQMAEW